MPLRITGFNSGLDTESIISELVKVKQTKVDKVKKEQQLLEWKQDAWKELNTKLLNLFQKTLGNMRFTSAYGAKKTTASNPNAVSVIAGENAPNGVQSMTVDRLATAGYLTGAKIGASSASAKLESLGFTGDGSFSITVGSKTTEIKVTKDTKISDVVSKLQSAGVDANYDAKNGRFFISSKKTGAASDFTISAESGSDGENAMRLLGLDENNPDTNAQATKIKGENAKITLNGAEFESSTNVFEINGLTITALTETNEKFTLTTALDTEGIYDTIKNFIKEYNDIINEMDKLYNAESTKYQPLTDEEKDSLSEKEIEKWEDKIKESVLRRDESVSSVSNALKSIMLAGVTVNGKQMYLSDFGINTLGYFLSGDNEKSAYHIDGDPDDSSTSGNEDKLRSLITTNPDTVRQFFLGLSRNMYDKMSEMSSRIDGYRSFNSFYYDKKMKSDYDDYTKKIKDLETKLAEYEDKWYRKFGAMETALAKLQSNQSAVAALIGG